MQTEHRYSMHAVGPNSTSFYNGMHPTPFNDNKAEAVIMIYFIMHCLVG